MTHRPTTPGDHIAHAKDTLTGGANPTYAIAHALIAIAELQLEATAQRAADIAVEKLTKLTNIIVGPPA